MEASSKILWEGNKNVNFDRFKTLFCVKVAPAKRTSMETQSKQSSMQRRSRSRSSSSDDEKKKSKAPAGPPSINYQIVYQQSSLIVTVLACKVNIRL